MATQATLDALLQALQAQAPPVPPRAAALGPITQRPTTSWGQEATSSTMTIAKKPPKTYPIITAPNPLPIEPGPMDNLLIYKSAFKQDPLATGFVLYNVNLPPFQSAQVPKVFEDKYCLYAAHLLGIARASSLGRIEPLAQYITTIGESLAPCLPASSRLSQLDARGNLYFLVCYLMTMPTTSTTTGRTLNDYTVAISATAATPGILSGITGLPKIFPWSSKDDPQFDSAASMLILMWLAQGYYHSFPFVAVEIITYCHLAFAKRGTVSTSFLRKITDAFKDELKIGMALDASIIRGLYASYGHLITGDNAGALFNHWISLIPTHAIRSKITLQQTTYEGLTQITTITKAYIKYPDFCWDRMCHLFPDEFDRLILALTTLNGNPYYGFNKNLGPVAAPNYKEFAYVAKELLVRIGGEVALNNYGGWPKSIQNKVLLDNLVVSYETHHRTLAFTQDLPDALADKIELFDDAIHKNLALL